MKRFFALIAFLLWASVAHAAGALYLRNWSQGPYVNNATSGTCYLNIGTLPFNNHQGVGPVAGANDLLVMNFGHGSTIGNGTNTSGCTTAWTEVGTSGWFKAQGNAITVTSGQASCTVSNASTLLGACQLFDVADSDGNVPVVDAISAGKSNGTSFQGTTDTLTTTAADELVIAYYNFGQADTVTNADPFQQGQIPIFYSNANAAATYMTQDVAGASVPQAVITNGSIPFNSQQIAIKAGDAGTHNTVGRVPPVGIYNNWTTNTTGTQYKSVGYNSAVHTFQNATIASPDLSMGFNGVDNYVTTAVNTIGESASAPFTEMFCMNVPSGYNQGGFIISATNGCNGNLQSARVWMDNTGHIVDDQWNGSVSVETTSGTHTYNDGQNHCFARVYDGTVDHLYDENGQVGSTTTNYTAYSNAFWTIGCSVPNNSPADPPTSNFIEARIGEVAIWMSTALSSTQVASVLSHMNDGTFDAQIKALATQPTYWWPLFDNTSSARIAELENNNTGVMNGTITGQGSVPVHLVDVTTTFAKEAITADAGLTSRVSMGDASTYGISIADKSVTAAGNYGPYTDTVVTGAQGGSALIPFNPTGPGDTVAFVNSATSTCSATPCTVTMVATPTSGNILLAAEVGTNPASVGNRPFNVPTGWHVLTSIHNNSVILWKISNGSETNLSITYPGGAPTASWAITQWSGVNNTTPFTLTPVTATALYPSGISTNEPVVVELCNTMGGDFNFMWDGSFTSVIAPSDLGGTLFDLVGPNGTAECKIWCHQRGAGDPSSDSWSITPDGNGTFGAGGTFLHYVTYNYAATCSPTNSAVVPGPVSAPITLTGLNVPSPGGYFTQFMFAEGENSDASHGLGGWLDDQPNFESNNASDLAFHVASTGFAAGATGNDVMNGVNPIYSGLDGLEAGLVIAPAQVNTGAGGAWMMY
jgi:hypothetical protein